MEAKVIIAQNVKSGKNNVNVWLVAIQGEEEGKMYCKSAYKALRYAFLLKKRTGVNISENCITRLSQEIRQMKSKQQAEQTAEGKAEVAEAPKQPEAATAEEPKPKARKPRKSTAKTVSIDTAK